MTTLTPEPAPDMAETFDEDRSEYDADVTNMTLDKAIQNCRYVIDSCIRHSGNEHSIQSKAIEIVLAALAQRDARIAELEAGLRPFSRMADQIDQWQMGSDPHFQGEFDANDLRRARSVLANTSAEPEVKS